MTPRVSMVARVGVERVTADLATLVSSVRSQCARRSAAMVVDALVPTDVLVCTGSQVDTVRLTTGQVHATGVRPVTSAVLGWREWCAPSSCAAPPLARAGVIPVRRVLASWSVTLGSSRMFTVASAWTLMSARPFQDCVR